MAKTLPHITQVEELSNVYGTRLIADLLGVTERAMQIWSSDPDRSPRKETLGKLGELFAKFKAGENLAQMADTNDYRGRYIISLEDRIKDKDDRIKTLEDQLNLVIGQLRHVILLTHALSETNQDAIIQMMAKQKIASGDELNERMGIMNTENYQNMKDELGIVEPSDTGRRVKL